MTIICRKFFPNELAALQSNLGDPAFRHAVTYSGDEKAEKAEEKEENET